MTTSSRAERTAFQSLPGHSAIQRKKVLVFDVEQSAALSFSSTLSLPAPLDAVPGRIAAPIIS